MDDDLQVVESLRSLDGLLSKQRHVWLDQRNAALSADGKQTPEWWDISNRLNPITMHGELLIRHAIENAETPEALICLAYIVDWGEGNPRDLYVSALEELIAHHRDDPALSWICSRCTNPLSLVESKAFLTRLRAKSTNENVQASAEYHLAVLLDHAREMHRRIPEIRDSFQSAGAMEARPEFSGRLLRLEKLNPTELENQRDELLARVRGRLPRANQWTVKRTFGRLDYRFAEAADLQSFQQLAGKLAYEVANLREGCAAPNFTGKLADGGDFQLAARRGAPTLLMFSFKGCGACEAMYPTLREIQDKYSNDGFTIVGIMVDPELGTVTAARDSGEITWPCVWDGAAGPIAEAFRVRFYPTVLLLDGNGRIAARNLHQKKHFAAHIEKLLEDQKKTGAPEPSKESESGQLEPATF